MRKHYLDIERKWAVIFAYRINASALDEISSWLEALGCGDEQIAEACHVIMQPNTGFTFSNQDLKMCVGNATSDEQWWDTLVHEIKHVQSHICSYYGVPEKSEEASYLIGYIMRLAIRSLKSDRSLGKASVHG